MGSLHEVRDILEQAGVFERAGDLTGAVARAEAALRGATDQDSREAARLALERLKASEHAWRAEVERRQAAGLVRERAGAAGLQQR